MNILQSSMLYESWLGERASIQRDDLQHKYEIMTESPFIFLRGTFYRWMQQLSEKCPDVVKAPQTLAVGDLHVDNFGTWRDVEGRLVWGINDFDEACVTYCINDLIRLATSAALATEQNHLAIKVKDACQAITEGYLDAMGKGGYPFVLAEKHDKLRAMAFSDLRDSVRYWRKLCGLPVITSVPPLPMRILKESFTSEEINITVYHRVAGVGSLGRPRYTAIAEWQGGLMAREAKTLVESACNYLEKSSTPNPSLYSVILKSAVRSLDPYFQIISGWIVRRLAPDCSRIDIASLPKDRDELHLMYCMGWETANIHLGDKKNAPLAFEYVRHLPYSWMISAVEKMTEDTIKDWKQWKASDWESSMIH